MSPEYAEMKGNMDFRNILIAMINLDLWILINVGRSARKLTKLLRPILEIAILMILGGGLLSIFAIPRWQLRIANFDEIDNHETVNPSKDPLLEITDESSLNRGPELEREINHLKNKAFSLEIALRRMNSQLRTFHMRDRIKEEMADFASEAAGGTVLETPNTKSYHKTNENHMTLFGISLCKPNFFTPRKVIQPWSQAGECWAFQGERGNIKIKLAYPAIIEQISLEHVSQTASPTGKIDSAPREFQVTALINEGSKKIGNFIYNQYGPPSQIFQITEEESRNIPVEIVLLSILSNWGNPNYTCIYRFKVHGRISP